jgi:hypothetical protein
MSLLYDIISSIRTEQNTYFPASQYRALRPSIDYMEKKYYCSDLLLPILRQLIHISQPFDCTIQLWNFLRILLTNCKLYRFAHPRPFIFTILSPFKDCVLHKPYITVNNINKIYKGR